jgi:hypothetical protein
MGRAHMRPSALGVYLILVPVVHHQLLDCDQWYVVAVSQAGNFRSAAICASMADALKHRRYLLRHHARLAKARRGRESLQCERCGGTGQQEAGLWDGEAYAAPAGVCDHCGGAGRNSREEGR